jgi:DNA mismatch repair protein MutH
MANKQRGFVKIELDKVRHLRYTMNALAEIEDQLGVPLSEMKDVKMTIKNVRVILWAGLIHEDAELTQEEVGNMVDLGNFEEVQQKIAEAFAMADKGKNS